MTAQPPRRLAREPFPQAADLHPIPVDVENAEPFELRPPPVTNEQLAERIGEVAAHVRLVHGEAAQARLAAVQARDAATAAAASASSAHSAIDQLRRLVLGDHAPRITEVERRAPIAIPNGVKKGALYTVLASAWPLLEYGLPLLRELLAKSIK